MFWRNACLFQPIHATEENPFVPDVVPCCVEFALGEFSVAILNGGHRLGMLLRDQARVDSLREADFEIPISKLFDSVAPIWTAKKVVVEQVNLLRPRSAAPDARDSPRIHRKSLFVRNFAESSARRVWPSHPAAALRVSKGCREFRVIFVVVVLVGSSDVLNGRRAVNPGPADDPLRPLTGE